MALVGRLAVVSGAGSGIGRAVANKLSKQGATVGILDVDSKGLSDVESEINGTNGTCYPIQCSVTDRVRLEQALSGLSAQCNMTPTIGINCAGILRDSMLLKMTDEQWDDVVTCHLKGTFIFTQLLARAMSKAGLPGSIVNTGSISGKIGNMGQANYAASKAGIVAFTKVSARELASKGIRCNTVVPGFVESPMTDSLPEHIKNITLMMTPMQRFGKPSELADVYCYLAGDESSFVTGIDIEVAGGLAI